MEKFEQIATIENIITMLEERGLLEGLDEGFIEDMRRELRVEILV